MWFSDKSAVDRVTNGGPAIQKKEVESDKDRIPDEVLENNISAIKTFFTKDAWQTIQETSKDSHYLES